VRIAVKIHHQSYTNVRIALIPYAMSVLIFVKIAENISAMVVIMITKRIAVK
jgi:hypothetical protein